MSYENETGRTSPHDDLCRGTGTRDQSAPGPIPLVAKFETDRGRYAYDGNTGAIVKLDRITYELLDFIGTGPKCEVPASIAAEFPPDEIACSHSRLEALLKKSGVFRPVSIKSRLASPAFVAQNWHRIAGKFDDLTLEVTQNCNMRCRYCVYSGAFNNQRVHNRLPMSWDIARKAIDFFLKNPSHERPTQHVTFYGGEPILNMRLITDCVGYVRSRDPSVTFGLITNGTLLTEQVRRFLEAHDFYLYVSLDGPREVHDQNRTYAGGKGTFETITRNLGALKDSAPEYYEKRVFIQCVVSPGVNFRKLLDFFASASDLIGSQLPTAGTEIPGTSTHISASLLAEFTNGFKALEERFLQKVIRGDRKDSEFAFLRAVFEKAYLLIHRRPVRPDGWGETFHTIGTCFPGNFRLFVRADGKLLMCVKSNNALEIGDVERGLEGKKVCEIYRAYHDLHQTECRRCWASHLCTSCYATDTRRTGTFEARLDPEQCEDEREFWRDKLRKYASVQEQNPGAFDYLNEVKVFRARVPLLDFEPSDPECRPEVH